MALNKEELIAVCRNENKIYIYGAGKMPAKLTVFCRRIKFQQSGLLLRIYLLIRKIDYLIEHYVQNVCFFTPELLEDIQQELLVFKLKETFNAGVYRIGENIPVEMLHSILVMEDASGQEYHWRFRNWAAEEQNLGSIADLFPKQSALEEFEEQYGRYHVFRTITQNAVHSGGTYAVYMVRSHGDKFAVKSELPSWPIPIQAGAALTEQNICELKDNMGGIYRNC